MAKELSPELTAHLMTALDWIGQAGTRAAPFHVMLHTGSPIEFKDASAQFAGTAIPTVGSLIPPGISDFLKRVGERAAAVQTYEGSDDDTGPDHDIDAEREADVLIQARAEGTVTYRALFTRLLQAVREAGTLTPVEEVIVLRTMNAINHPEGDATK